MINVGEKKKKKKKQEKGKGKENYLDKTRQNTRKQKCLKLNVRRCSLCYHCAFHQNLVVFHKQV